LLYDARKKMVEKEDAYTIPENEASVYIEAYPCPPAKGCPTTTDQHNGYHLSKRNFFGLI